MKIPFGLAEITKLDIEHCALLSIILGFHKNNKPLFMLNKPLSKITGMSENKVRQKLKNLQNAGWIDIQLNVKNDYYFYDRLITFKKDINLLEEQLEALESKLLTFDNNADADILLDYPTENVTPTKNSIVKTLDYPTENVTPTLTKTLDYPTENDTHIRLIDNDNRLVINKEEKNNKNSQINELICHQQNEINKIFDGIFDLSVKYSFDNLVNPDATQKLNDLLKSENMNKLKKTYLDIKKENTLEKKTYKNVLQYHKDNLKINCLSSIWLYDYEILKLRMKYNADYLLDTLYKCDLWLQDPTNFTKRIDHYSFIENWIKRDIGKKLEIKTHIQVDRYKYVNWGVDYDLFK
jgi:hypothetical protein